MTINPTSSEDTTTAMPAGTLEHLDPTTLILETNVRDEADLAPDFLASIAEHGVLIPIAAVRGADGRVLVRMGQRRTLAARQAGLTTVPVYVRPATPGDDTAGLVARISEQIMENDQRAGLTDAQRARGIQTLLDAGIPVTKVARSLSVHRDTVKAAAAVRRSPAATDALQGGPLSLTEAAALSEFEDLPGAAERLTRAAGTARFAHTVAQLREEQTRNRALQQAESSWRDKGFTVLDAAPRPWDTELVELRYLRDAAGDPLGEDAVSDPARWAVLLEEDDVLVDTATGEQVGSDEIDWATQDQPEAQPREGLRHADSVADAVAYLPTFYCRDYAAAGFTVDARFLRNAGVPTIAVTATAEAGHDGDEPATARADALAQAQAEQAEAQRRERRKVLVLNRLGEAAGQVRREFVTRLLARKTLPKGAAVFIADCLVREPGLIGHYHGAGVTAQLLGATEGPGVRQLVADLPAGGDGRAAVLILAVVLGALEARTPKDAWRYPRSTVGLRYNVGRDEYLVFLIAQGYEPADVERVITGQSSAEELYEATLSEAGDSGER